MQLSCGSGVKKNPIVSIVHMKKLLHISLPAVLPICRRVLLILCGLQKGLSAVQWKVFFLKCSPILPLRSDQMFVIQPDCYQVSDMLFSHGNKLSIEEGGRAELSMRVDP